MGQRRAGTCAIDGCDGAFFARDWCSKHYGRWYKHGDPFYERPTKGVACRVEGCTRLSKGRGFCAMHYERVLRNGEPGPPGPLYELRSAVCMADLCDEPVMRAFLCRLHYNRWFNGRPVAGVSPRTARVCIVPECDRPVHGRSLCATHYNSPQRPLLPGERPCSVDGCERAPVAKGLCASHWQSQRGNKRKKYGLSREQFAALLASQGGCCAVCGTDTPGTTRDWHVDHDHVTGVVRGVLCHYCNVGLGHFKDDIRRLRAAINYIERHGAVDGDISGPEGTPTDQRSGAPSVG